MFLGTGIAFQCFIMLLKDFAGKYESSMKEYSVTTLYIFDFLSSV